jgi:hypothetical protein
VLFAISSSLLNYYLLYHIHSHDLIFFYFLNQICFQLKSILCIYAFYGELLGAISLSYHLYYLTLAFYIIGSETRKIHVTGKMVFLGILAPAMTVNYFYEFVSPWILILFSCLMLTTQKYSSTLISITEREMFLLPVVADLLVTTFLSPEGDLTTKTNMAIVSYCMVVLIYIKPLYDHNTVLLYLLSFVYEYMLCNL